VITYIDNSVIFQQLSRNYPGSAFYAVQNGMRNWEFQDDSIKRTVSLTNFICFGQNEIDLAKKCGHSIDNFFPVGSIKGSFFRYSLSKIPHEKEFDVCLISQYRNSIMEGGEYPDFKQGLEIIEQYLKRFCEKYPVKVCVALNSENRDEIEYFSRVFGGKAILIRNSEERIHGCCFSTYYTMDKSRVVITLLSTAGVEAFGWGEKVLFCNFTGNDVYNIMDEDFFILNEPDYNKFEEKLVTLIRMSDLEYRSLTQTSREYLMNYNPDLQVHEFIKKLISDTISRKTIG
jgi:surface carbohydrate biosynthesis protein